jgi:hypothetical protein
MGIHFTVRLALANRRNKSWTLKNWETKLPATWTVQWVLGERTLQEDELKSDTVHADDEYKILTEWCNGQFQEVLTDRTRFAEELRGLIQDTTDVSVGNLSLFVDFLRAHMVFEEHQLAPREMYPPQRN